MFSLFCDFCRPFFEELLGFCFLTQKYFIGLMSRFVILAVWQIWLSLVFFHFTVQNASKGKVAGGQSSSLFSNLFLHKIYFSIVSAFYKRDPPWMHSKPSVNSAPGLSWWQMFQNGTVWNVPLLRASWSKWGWYLTYPLHAAPSHLKLPFAVPNCGSI